MMALHEETTKFSKMSILRLANAIAVDGMAVDGMVVESDPFGSGKPLIGFKYRQIDMRPAICSLPGSGEPRKLHALHTRICCVLNIRPKIFVVTKILSKIISYVFCVRKYFTTKIKRITAVTIS